MGWIKFPRQAQFNAPVTVGKDATGYDVIFYGDTTGKYFQWDESTDTALLAGATTLAFRATDIAVLSSAASTLAIRNNRASGSILIGSTASYISVDQSGFARFQDLKGVEFISPDLRVYPSAASTLSIENNRAAGTVRVGSTGSYASISQAGDVTLQDLKAIQFISSDIRLYTSAASTLSIENNRATGPIRIGSSGSYMTVNQAGNATLMDGKYLYLAGGTTNYLGSGAANRVDLVTAACARLGSAASYVQVESSGLVTLVGQSSVQTGDNEIRFLPDVDVNAEYSAIGRGTADTDRTYIALRNSTGCICYFYPNSTGSALVASGSVHP